MTDRELMQQALDVMLAAIKAGDWKVDGACDPDWVLNAIRARLAQPEQKHSEAWWRHEVSNAFANGYEKGRASAIKQPEQEPVAWADRYDLDREGHDFWVSRQANVRTGIPLYTAPPQREWQGLTDGEIKEQSDLLEGEWISYEGFARAIEAKLKEKNSA